MRRKRSIRYALNQLVILPLICLGIIILAVSVPVIYGAMETETEDGLKNLSHALLEKCNVMGEGDYNLESGILTKGGVPFGQDHYVVDSIKEVSGVDATIFWGDTRMLTTILGTDGERICASKASATVVNHVLDHGMEYFTTNVEVNGVSYYGYYIPIRNSDDSVVGMVFVGKTRKLVINTIFFIIFRVFLVVLAVVTVTLVFALKYAENLVYSLNRTREFLGNVAQGDIECEIDKSLLQRCDEIGEMGRFAVLLQESIVKLIGTDPLTGLYNRRTCSETLDRILKEYQKNQQHFALAIGDIDNFKNLNDTYGHLAGDYVLKELSKIFMEHMKGKGMVARWGGEEFLFIYEDMECRKAQEAQEELLDIIRDTEIKYNGESIRVTMTFGISKCRDGDCVESILKRADDRLYMGKMSGKNRLVSTDERKRGKGEIL